MGRRQLIVACGVAVVLYSAAVVWYAHGVPDIGIHCVFETQIQDVAENPTYLAPDPQNVLPERDDYIVGLGSKPIATWPRLLRTLAELDEDMEQEGEEVRTYEELQEAMAVSSAPYIRWQGERYVKVAFIREQDEPDRLPHVVWSRVGKLPATALVPSLLWFLLKFGLFTVGAVVYWKRPEEIAARRFFLLCLVTMPAYMGGYHWSRIAGYPPLIVVFMIAGVLLPAVCLHFYLVFPKPKEFVRRHARLSLTLLYSVPALILAAMLSTYAVVVWTFRLGYDAEIVKTALRQFLLNEVYVSLAVAGLLFIGCLVCLMHSFFTSRQASLERNQVKWILTGALLAAIPIGYTLTLAMFWRDEFAHGGSTWPMFMASLFINTAYVISITRYRWLEVDKVLNWGIVYFAISVATALVYYGLVFLLIGSQIGPQFSFSQAALVSTSAFLLLVVVEVFRWRLRRVFDRRLHRARYQLDQTLQEMSQAVEQLVDPATLSKRLMDALADLLSFERGALYLRGGEPPVFRLAAHRGTPPAMTQLAVEAPLVIALAKSPLVHSNGDSQHLAQPAQRQLSLLSGEIGVALHHEGSLMGLLVVGSRFLGRYGPEESHLLMTFARVAALALHGAKGHQTIDALNHELQAKVEKISEQQRRILTLQSQLLRQADRPRPEVREELATAGIVGASPAVQQMLHIVRKVSVSPSAVLIRGESGTGKELLARALHENSPRRGQPFVKVHCAALSPTLLESELFGHVKGAYTGAYRDKVGRFELANGGTLFLDEIGDISSEVQTKLLRVLQEKQFEPVGSSEPVAVDVRIIAATHQNLEELMRQGRFRDDLFYRLNVITIRTPALRERREDIYELALHFLKTYNERSGKNITHIEDEALETLKAYRWPGNIRELENVIERAVVLAEGPIITLRELPEEIMNGDMEPEAMVSFSTNGADESGGAENLSLSEPEWLARKEQRDRDRLVRALATAAGNKAQAARALGLPRTTFMSKLKKYGLS